MRPPLRSPSGARLVTTALVALLASAVVADTAAAQGTAAAAPSTFTADDALDVVTWTIGDLSRDGRWIAALATARRDAFGTDFRRDGDPTYIRPSASRLWVVDTRSGERTAVLPQAGNIRSPRWSPDGARLAFLRLDGDVFVPVIWNRASGKLATARLPNGRYVAENSDVRWTPDGARLVLSLHTIEWRRAARDTFAVMTGGPVFVQRSTDPFLAWDALRRAGSVQSIATWDPSTGQTVEVLPEASLGTFELADDGATIAFQRDITKKTDYDVIFGRDLDLEARDLRCAPAAAACGSSRVLRASLKGATIDWSRDGRRYAYSKDGRVFVGTVSDTAARQVAGPPAGARVDSADTSAAARDRRARERFALVRYSPTADALVASNKDGLWLVDAATSARELVVATSDSTPALPRATLAAWSDDGRRLYFTFSSRSKWERGIEIWDRDAHRLEVPVKDGRMYSGLRVSRDGGTVVLSVADGNRPPDLYVADAKLTSLRRLVDENPQLAAKRFGPTRLLSYLDADGHAKNGVVYLPADYVEGRPCPTIFIVYEDFFDDAFDATANVFAGRGYAVVKPSVDFDIGYPGEAWEKGVTAAANKLVELGISDSSRMGVQGTSYGGYATNLLVTQTRRFRAAINISGKVDVVSFYTDSPRLGVRNVHAAEKSQDRLGATLWQQPQKYVQHSAVFFADRITTPLMLITGEQDSNVPADNTREMYYALRRLGKEVVWVNYMNGGHGGGTATAADFLDMHRRMLAWYDDKLKQPAGKVAIH